SGIGCDFNRCVTGAARDSVRLVFLAEELCSGGTHGAGQYPVTGQHDRDLLSEEAGTRCHFKSDKTAADDNYIVSVLQAVFEGESVFRVAKVENAVGAGAGHAQLTRT